MENQLLDTHKQCVSYFTNLVLKYTETDCWIAGGAVRDYWLNGYIDESTDIDIFTSDRQRMARILKNLRNKVKFKHFLINENVVKGFIFIGKKKYYVDVVKKPFETMQSTINEFDFTVCGFAVSIEKMICLESAPFDLLRKKIIINKLPFPMATMQRLQKYIRKGYTICNGGLLIISKAVKEIDFENPQENNIEFYPDGSPRFLRFD